MLIQTRNRALINMAATDADFEKYMRPPKERPVSAPMTRQETDKALLSANETDKYVLKHTPAKLTTKPHILAVIQQETDDEPMISVNSDVDVKDADNASDKNVEEMQE